MKSDVRAVEAAVPLADPEEVPRTARTGDRRRSGQRALVLQRERLVRAEQRDGAQRLVVVDSRTPA
jgi:hypothetical protein